MDKITDNISITILCVFIIVALIGTLLYIIIMLFANPSLSYESNNISNNIDNIQSSDDFTNNTIINQDNFSFLSIPSNYSEYQSRLNNIDDQRITNYNTLFPPIPTKFTPISFSRQ